MMQKQLPETGSARHTMYTQKLSAVTAHCFGGAAVDAAWYTMRTHMLTKYTALAYTTQNTYATQGLLSTHESTHQPTHAHT